MIASMRVLRSPWRLAVVLLAAFLPVLGCKSMFKQSNTPPPRGDPDEPAPLHTGGLSVLSGHPDAPGNHGNPTAAAIATGIGVASLGAGGIATLAACARADASAGCLAGPGPAVVESDASAPAGH